MSHVVLFTRYAQVRGVKRLLFCDPKSSRPRKFTRSDAIYAARLLGWSKAQNASTLARRYFLGVSAETIRVHLAKVSLYAYSW